MKDEEFNDLLQFHAESFELKPTSGSFDSVMRKLHRQKRHKLVVRLMPMAAAIAALPVAWFVFRDTPKTPAENTAHHIEVPAVENKGIPNAGSQDFKGADNQEVPGNTNKDVFARENGSGNADIPPVNENNMLVAESPVNTPAMQTADTADNKQAPTWRSIPSSEESVPVMLAEQLPAIKIHPENQVIEGKVQEPQPVFVSIPEHKINNQKQAIRPEDPKAKRCEYSKFAVSAFATPFIGGLFTAGYASPDQSAEQKTAYNIGGQPVSYTTGNERPLPSMAAGLKVSFMLPQGWSVSAGITYAALRMNKSVFTLVAERDPGNLIPTLNSMQAYETRRKIAEDKYKVAYNYISVPVQVAYSFKHKKWGIDLTAGTAFNMLQSVTEPVREQPSGNYSIASLETASSDFRRITVGINAGAYVNYSLGNCVDIYAGPQAGSGIQSVYKPQSARQAAVPVTVGLETGLKIYF